MPPLKTAFDFLGSCSSVLLRQGELRFAVDGYTYSGNGKGILRLAPSARIQFVAEFPGVDPICAMELLGRDSVQLAFDNYPFEGFCVNRNYVLPSGHLTAVFTPRTEPVNCLGNDSTQIRSVVFHLFNQAVMFGSRRRLDKTGIRHFVDLQDANYKVTIASLPCTKENTELLKSDGGHRLTHVGRFQAREGRSITGDEARAYLDALTYFLSFKEGRWCNPVCAVGFDSRGKRVWELWSAPREPWRSLHSWFDHEHNEQLRDAFPLFMSKYADANWHDAILEAIYWYLNANNGSRGIDAGIILAQTAIERLAFEYVVNFRKLLTRDGFARISAAERYRLLFSSLDIPIAIPASLSELSRLAKSYNWGNAPQALTEVRNSLVHPEHKARGKFSQAYTDAWLLGLWYLELTLLRICNYSGTYADRLQQGRFVGQVVSVPWTP